MSWKDPEWAASVLKYTNVDMKRSAYAAGMADRRAAAVKRRRASKTGRAMGYGPVRAYSGSMVPTASRGYRLNTKERKVYDNASSSIQVNSTGTFLLLACPTPGTDMNGRIGRKIVLKSLYVRGFVCTESSRNTSIDDVIVPSTHCRMIIFVDCQPNGAAPAVTDLLVEATTSSQLNLNNRDRFKVLCDKQYAFDPLYFNNNATFAMASASRQIYNVKKYKKLNIETIFNAGSAGTIADITSGALYMFWLGNQSAIGGIDNNAVVSTRCRYDDN